MDIKALLKTLNQNKKLTRNAIIHYLSLLYLSTVNPCAIDAYIATEVTEKELKELGLLAGGLSSLNALLTEQGLLKKLEGKSQGTYILGEKNVVDTLSGKVEVEAWYFSKPVVEVIEHGEKVRASKIKTYVEEIKEAVDFYHALYSKKYGVAPAINYKAIHKILRPIFQQFPFRLVKACIPIYLELGDEYLESKRYPIAWMMSRMVECQLTLQEKLTYYGMQNKADEFYERWILKIIQDKKLTSHENYLNKRNGGVIAKQNGSNDPKPEGGGEHLVQASS